jgi:hypothetical protein
MGGQRGENIVRDQNCGCCAQHHAGNGRRFGHSRRQHGSFLIRQKVARAAQWATRLPSTLLRQIGLAGQLAWGRVGGNGQLVFGEWDYMNFGTHNVTFTDDNFGSTQVGVKQQINVLKLGINYRFGNSLPQQYP